MRIFYEVHQTHIPLWEKNDWRYAVFMGGRGNGRSGTASRYAVSQLVSKEFTRGTIMRATREDIRGSSWQALSDRIIEQQAEQVFNITDREITYGQNSLTAFGFRASSGSLTARLKSLEGVNFSWIEEAEEVGEKEFVTFDDTLRTIKGRIRIVLTLNTPQKNHWILRRWFNLTPSEQEGYYIPKLKEDVKDVLYIPGTWRENEPNLDFNTIERYKRYQQTRPAYFWQMIEGLSPDVGVGRIYSSWQEISEIPHEARLLGYGLDFGFNPDPAAFVAIYYYNGGYILDELLYQTNLLNEQLAANIKFNPRAVVIADSAEPKSIAELKKYRINILACGKGADSVQYGIKHVQGLKISYTSRSVNLKREYENYSWKIDKDGNSLGVEDPNCDNHCMSAIRYFLTDMIKAGIPEDDKPKYTSSLPKLREFRKVQMDI